MGAQAARVEPAIDPVEEHQTETDGQIRPAASLSAEMIVRPEDVGKSSLDPLFPPEEAALGGSGPRDPQDPIQEIRRSLKGPDRGGEQPTIEYKPAPNKGKRSLSWGDLVIYTACYFVFLMIAMYVLDVMPGFSINDLLGSGS